METLKIILELLIKMKEETKTTVIFLKSNPVRLVTFEKASMAIVRSDFMSEISCYLNIL